MKKAEIKPGRSAAKLGVLFGTIGIVFGIMWIVLLLSLSSRDDGLELGAIFLLVFGAMFIIAAIGVTVFYAKSAYGRKRPSLWDVEKGDDEEAGATAGVDERSSPDADIVFCPYCGREAKKDFIYCRSCGKKMS